MKIALVGNPNSGKTSIFNQLTGLNQRVGNYPGITVDKKVGVLRNTGSTKHTLLDLPGTYSIYPRSYDEEVVFDVLIDPQNPDYPDLVIVTVDATNLERNLLLFTQLCDMGLPVILALNMTDVAGKQGLEINHKKLSELCGNVPVIPVVARSGQGIDKLREAILNYQKPETFYPINLEEFHGEWEIPSEDKQQELAQVRYKKIRQLMGFCVKTSGSIGAVTQQQRKVDRLVTHPIWGYVIFLSILFLIFQAIYSWAEWPMDMIDTVFLSFSQWIGKNLPEGALTNLIAQGIIPGLGGVVIFIPQIALLFTFIFILEETGYMSRVVFIMDRLMRPFGLNGKSVVPLISGVACAIPAIMATRTIDNWKERLITIMVTPLMSCSARLPVYTLLIALVIPDESIGPFNLKGFALLFLYLIGLIAALVAALVFKFIIRSKQTSFLVMELPLYKMPRWKNLFITIFEKVKIFVFEAGRVIMAISIILWVLASYGPGNRIERAVSEIPQPVTVEEQKDYVNKVSAVALENSYIGIIGQFIEPAIRPLGYNWQIGIALITSFAAREVFVGSMATIYSVGEDFENEETLIQRMRNEKNEFTGEPVYTLASGLSLMVFYAFAMQCMSTLAIVLRETKKWKWPLIQLVYMTVLAYLSALLTYQILT